MQIHYSNKPITQAPKRYTRVVITDKSTNRLVVKSGREVLEVGAKKFSDVTRRRFVLLCRSVVATAKQNKCVYLAVQFDPALFPKLKEIPLPESASIMAQAFEMANFEFIRYKTPSKEGPTPVKDILICSKISPEVREGFTRGQTIGQEVNACRELANTPGGDMTPHSLAESAKAAAKGLPIKVSVLGKKEMEKLGMGAVLGVAKGSSEEPKFIIMEYRGGKTSERPTVLVGKGVTFDTGGLSLKPADSMYEMHMDMSGGAAVIHAIVLAAKLGVQKNVVALVPAVENSPSGSSVRPGDILKSLSGKTIEILNTDAEGRVILADALTYAKRYKPSAVIDVATLTGAALVALGTQASGFMTNQESQIPKLMQMGEESGDYLWPFPAWEEYEEMTKGTFGDVPNISTAGNSRHGGVIAGGMFLREFIKDLGSLWVHIDMAPRMTATQNEFLAKGAAGAPVRLLLQCIEHAD